MTTSTIHTTRLDNDLTLVVEPMPAVRAAAFSLLLPAGAAADPRDRLGAAHMLQGYCYRGAGDMDSRQLSDSLDGLGLQRAGGCGVETSAFGGALLADALVPALRLCADIIRRPRLPEADLDAEKALARQELDNLNDSPPHKLFVNLHEVFFANEYGRFPIGDAQSITALTTDDLHGFHRDRYRPSQAILGIAGRVDYAAVHRAVEEIFGDWEGDASPLTWPRIEGRGRRAHIAQDTEQMQIGVAYPEVAMGVDSYYDARMAVEVLSGGMGARLFTEVREKRGLVYSVSARYTALKGLGAVLCYAGTTPERSNETLEVLINELRRLSEGITQDELDRARTGLLSALVMQGESSRARAGALVTSQFHLGRVRTLDEIRRNIEAVTVDSVRRHLTEHPPQDFTIVTLGPQEIVQPES